MNNDPSLPCTAFQGGQRLASGVLSQVAQAVRMASAQRDTRSLVLVFDDRTGAVVDIDLQSNPSTSPPATPGLADGGTTAAPAPRGPGRPKLGVVAREVTLLPRHWDWLRHQPGGASVALRKLVEEARRTHAGKDRIRSAQEAAYRFMSAMAGDEVGFEEAARALFAANRARFDEHLASWPADVRAYASRLAADAFEPGC